MQHLIMILIVIGLVIADILTGFIKAYIKDDIDSTKMRKGGLNKICEVLVMFVSCGLDIGISSLAKYYQSTEITAISSIFTSGVVFAYILIMEIISILENYAEINPDTTWVLSLLKKLRKFGNDDEK